MVQTTTLKNGVTRYPVDLKTGLQCYRLPTRTVGSRVVECKNQADAKTAGIWALGMFATQGVEKLVFGAHEGQDCVWVKFSNPSKQVAVEDVLQRFAANVGPDGKVKNAKLALLNRLNGITPEALMQRAKAYMAEHQKEPHIAGAKALIFLFNECVAGPDGGEVVFKRYVIEQGKGIVEVEMKAACASCPAQELSVAGQLQGAFVRHLPQSVHRVRVA